jgi:hypothetical protein
LQTRKLLIPESTESLKSPEAMFPGTMRAQSPLDWPTSGSRGIAEDSSEFTLADNRPGIA